MKRKIICVILGLSIMNLCACGDNDKSESKDIGNNKLEVSATTTSETEEDYTTISNQGQKPTGYDSNTVQQIYIVYNQKLYVSKDNNKYVDESDIASIYPDFKVVAQVKKISNEEIPDEDLEASRVNEGANVYANNDASELLIYDGCVIEMELK
ncbi:MAG: hypothetical protein GX225_00915 [Clostridiales bacterium]|nr:hypothetical protein [Clostridiales bacterium]